MTDIEDRNENTELIPNTQCCDYKKRYRNLMACSTGLLVLCMFLLSWVIVLLIKSGVQCHS